MGEGGTRVFTDVPLDALPGLLIGPDLVTIHADWQQPLQTLNMPQGLLQFLHLLVQLPLRQQNLLHHQVARRWKGGNRYHDGERRDIISDPAMVAQNGNANEPLQIFGDVEAKDDEYAD